MSHNKLLETELVSWQKLWVAYQLAYVVANAHATDTPAHLNAAYVRISPLLLLQIAPSQEITYTVGYERAAAPPEILQQCLRDKWPLFSMKATHYKTTDVWYLGTLLHEVPILCTALLLDLIDLHRCITDEHLFS